MPFKQQESHRNPMETRAALAAAKAEEEVARPRFHAQPIATGAAMQAVEAKAPTVPAPFKLAGDEHHSRSRAKLAAQKRLEEQARKAQTEFHATAIAAPAPAFVPAKSTRPLTEVQAFSLNGNARAAERDVYNRQAQMTRAKSQAAQDAAILDAEQRAMDVLRKQREFKGTAVPTYTVMKIKPSQRILTAPESPMVGKRGPTGIRA
jgi:targeting protein for Xklp2